MNIRSLTRGDGAVIGAAVLLLIASFLPFFKADSQFGGDDSINTWDSNIFPILPSVTLTAVAAAGALLAVRAGQFAGRQLLGLSLEQWTIALSLFTGWTALWSVLFHNTDGVERGAGAWLTLIFGVGMAVVAPLSSRLPALKAPLVGAPRPQQPYGGAVGGAQPYAAGPPQAGYGYPGGAQSVDPSFGQGQPAYGTPQPAAAATPAGDFSSFWFAVPVPRPLFAEDGSGNQIAELTPGTWYLAVDQRGVALVAQTQDGRRGLLQDSSGIQRG